MYIVFDIGGTNLRLATSTDGQDLDQTIIVPTPKRYDIALSTLEEQIKLLSGDNTIESVRGGIPAVLNHEKTIILKAAHLPDWEGKPLVQDLKKMFSCDVVKLENDSALGALGEAVRGAGKDFSSVVYIAVGTGVGGAWILNNKIVEASYSFDPGHQIVNPTGPMCIPCNQPGHLEAYIGKPEFNQYLAFGLYNSLQFWPADIIVLGGGIILNDQWDINKFEQELKKILPIHAQQITVTKATLGDKAGLYGALSL